jgi:hypothetical protein
MSRPDGSKLDMSQLEKILRNEMKEQGRHMSMNPLLTLPGMVFIIRYIIAAHIRNEQDLMCIWIHLSRSYTLFSSVQ